MTDTDPTKNEMLHDVLPETSPERAATYEAKDPDKRYDVICGDDRGPVDEHREAFLRYYGGLYGVTRVLITTLLAMGQDQIVRERFGDSFTEAARKVKYDIEAYNNVSLYLHSAVSNEEGVEFNLDSANGVGCAYGANIATISTLCADNDDLDTLTHREGTAMGSNDTVLVDNVRKANRRFTSQFFTPATAGMSRQDFAAVGAPIAVLKGDHAPSKDVTAILNFTHDKVSNPAKANEIGQPFYGNDVTQIAELLIRAYPQLQLDPEVLFAVVDSDVRATRAALAGGNASDIKQERLGDPRAAIDYLHGVQNKLNRTIHLED